MLNFDCKDSMKLTAALAPHQLKLRFFDVEVTIRADSQVYTNLFTQVYPRFLPGRATNPAQSQLEIIILSNAENPWQKPTIIWDGEMRHLKNSRLLEGYIHARVIQEIIFRVQSHFLFHAAVAARQGQAVIIAGESTFGKTTTTLELVRRGFAFLSDEIAAIDRSSRQVHPFPRTLRIRPDALERVGLTHLTTDAPLWMGKLFVDIERVRPHSLGEAAEISHIIILRHPNQPVNSNGKSGQELCISFDHLDKRLLKAISRIDEIAEVDLDNTYFYPAVKIKAARQFSAFSQIEAICRQQQVSIVDIYRPVTASPTFDQPARLEAISKREAIMALLRQYQGTYQFSGSDDASNDNNITHLFIELATLISQANCYKLSVGPLDQMADLICGLY